MILSQVADQFSQWCDHQVELVLITYNRYKITNPTGDALSAIETGLENLVNVCNALQDEVSMYTDTGAFEDLVSWIDTATAGVLKSCHDIYGIMGIRV